MLTPTCRRRTRTRAYLGLLTERDAHSTALAAASAALADSRGVIVYTSLEDESPNRRALRRSRSGIQRRKVAVRAQRAAAAATVSTSATVAAADALGQQSRVDARLSPGREARLYFFVFIFFIWMRATGEKETKWAGK